MKISILTVCPYCHKKYIVSVEEHDYYDWTYKRKLMQECFPYLSSVKRELLISGTCKEYWNKMFKPFEEDNDI